jgi:hypothetical protein
VTISAVVGIGIGRRIGQLEQVAHEICERQMDELEEHLDKLCREEDGEIDYN